MSDQLTGIEAERGYSYASIEDIAYSVRNDLGLDPEAALDMQEFFEFHLDDISVVYRGQHIQLVHGVAELTSEALTRWDPDSKQMELLLSESSYERLCEAHPRSNYTVGHELGHALLHTGPLIKLAELSVQSQAAMHRGKYPHPPYMDTEWQANAFASAFLMPARGIKAISAEIGEEPSARSIATQYGVSVEAASYRLDTFRKGKTGVR
jgi:hypothetical protein